jgi:hypothetical protein
LREVGFGTTSTEDNFDSEINSAVVSEPLMIDLNEIEESSLIEVVQLEPHVEVGNEKDLRSMPFEPTARVEIAFDQDCWTEITDVHGERFYYDLGRAGRMSVFDAHLPLSFLLGNASGVQIWVNGDSYTIPVSDHSDNVARFVITEDSRG